MATGKRKRLIQYGKQARKRRQASWPSDEDMSWLPDTNSIDYTQKPPPLPPNKPASQKEATMASEPPEEQISTLMDFTGLPRSQAVRYLKAKHNNVEAAAHAYYEGEDISKLESASQWSEDMFTADREGAQSNDRLLRPLTGSAAASRPNSPAPSGRSNIQPNSKQEEDDDMQRAIAMSQGGAGAAYQQETGRIGANGERTQFGPATKEYYDANQWSMVTVANTASEIVPDAEVEQRVHTPGEPRMLKHLTNGDYTPNLLTICHAINGAKRALLMPELVQTNYGQDSDWWRGHTVAMPKIVHVDDGTAVEPDSDRDDELLAEVQRLMAYLSAGDRSYASVGALTQTQTIQNANPRLTQSRTLLELFLQNWTAAASSKSEVPTDMAHYFTTRVGTTAPEGMDTPDMTLIDMLVTLDEGSKSDLFELLDGLLWDTDDNTITSDNYIERPADVLVIRVYQADGAAATQLRVEAPPELYVDKYLRENIESTRATRVEMANGKKRIAKIEEIEKKLKTWKHPTKNEPLDAGVLLKHTLGHFSGQNRIDVVNADKSGAYMPDEMKVSKPGYDNVAQKLEKVIASIESKLVILAEEKEKTRRVISDMSKAPPQGLQADNLKHRYTLRGVATKPNITYVLCPSDSSIDDEMTDDDTTPKGMRWWRLEYDASGTTAKITKTKTADYDVIRAVELEHSSALLVYASDRATNTTIDDNLPPALQEFVERDNELLAADLRAERNKPPSYSFQFQDVPRESIERTSMDSTRVEGGGSDSGIPSPPGYEDEEFLDHHGFGLGPVKQGYRQGEDEDEVHEIKLDDVEDEGVGMDSDFGTEMVQKSHQPLLSAHVPSSSDALMDEVSQDMGTGGSVTHVEDALGKH